MRPAYAAPPSAAALIAEKDARISELETAASKRGTDEYYAGLQTTLQEQAVEIERLKAESLAFEDCAVTEKQRADDAVNRAEAAERALAGAKAQACPHCGKTIDVQQT